MSVPMILGFAEGGGNVNVYYTTTAGGGTVGVVDSAPKDGTGVVKVVGSADSAPWLVRVDSKYVYFRTVTGGVWAVSKADGTTTLLSSGNADAASESLVDLALVFELRVLGREGSGCGRLRPEPGR